MIQVGACQTQGSFHPGERDPGLRTEMLTTLAAGRFAVRDEYLQCFIPFTLRFHSSLSKFHSAAADGSAASQGRRANRSARAGPATSRITPCPRIPNRTEVAEMARTGATPGA